ncbi:MAG: hypothetical protein ACLQBD_21605 [Syntrophobacteraceae bacterium]
MNQEERKYWKCYLVIALLQLFVMILGLPAAYFGIMFKVEGLKNDVLASRFRIIDPTDGAVVPQEVFIRGTTPFSGMNHYIIVTPIKTGDDIVQGGNLKVSSSGLWSGNAEIGSAGVGAGQQFRVVTVATKFRLPAGPITEMPKDAIFSESIIVTRQR